MKGLVEQPVMLCSPVVLLRDGVCCPRGRGGAGTRFQMTLWASPVLAQQASQSASFGSADCIGLLSATLSIPTNPAKHFFPPSLCLLLFPRPTTTAAPSALAMHGGITCIGAGVNGFEIRQFISWQGTHGPKRVGWSG